MDVRTIWFRFPPDTKAEQHRPSISKAPHGDISVSPDGGYAQLEPSRFSRTTHNSSIMQVVKGSLRSVVIGAPNNGMPLNIIWS